RVRVLLALVRARVLRADHLPRARAAGFAVLRLPVGRREGLALRDRVLDAVLLRRIRGVERRVVDLGLVLVESFLRRVDAFAHDAIGRALGRTPHGAGIGDQVARGLGEDEAGAFRVLGARAEQRDLVAALFDRGVRRRAAVALGGAAPFAGCND